MLVSDGSSANPILAPFQPATANYAIEAEVRIDATDYNNYFALVARLTQNGFYGAGDSWPSSCSATGYVDAWDSSNKYHDVAGANNTPDPGHGWHTYRLEIKDNKITFSFDGSVLVSANDNRYLDAGQVGLLTSGVQLSVRSFKVIAL